MSDVWSVFDEIVESGEDMRIMLLRGILEPLGKIPAAEVKFTNSGSVFFRGCISAKETVQGRNGPFELNTKIPLVAYGKNAEALMGMGLQEGDYVFVLAKFGQRKTENGYMSEAEVVAVERL